MLSKFQEVKSCIKTDAIINGANGISLFKDRLNLESFIFCNNINIKLKPAPIQKASIMANTPPEKPSKKPTPIASFASPKPIHFPPDISQKKAKKEKSIGPASRSNDMGKLNNSLGVCVKNNTPKENVIKVKTMPSGIILCLKS